MEEIKKEAVPEPDGAPEAVENGVHNYSEAQGYVPPGDPRVAEHLEWWKDQKLGLMMHWGPYSQLGLVESWALSDQDAEWSRTDVGWDVSADEFKRQYFALGSTFNPVRFQPQEWARAAADAGFRYLTFTTKHHDGFCMFDSQYSDYKITSPCCPFHANRYADICKHLFEAFRRQGMGIFAYFSKADWHVPSYWDPQGEKGGFTWRGPSYRPEEHPERWEQFVRFTHNQLLELCQNYGKIDALWLDAGWVCRRSGQDIRIEEAVERCRRVQPWLICADRTIGGPYENIITPEQCVPPEPLDVPWESCITMGTSFSFKYEDANKSPREVIALLAGIVAKGGSLALNVGPQPDGRLPEGALRTMRGMGEWLRRNGESIYGTRVQPPFQRGQTSFTRRGDARYAIHCFPDAARRPDAELFLPWPEPCRRAVLLDGEIPLEAGPAEGGIRLHLPDRALDTPTGEPPIALAFRLEN